MRNTTRVLGVTAAITALLTAAAPASAEPAPFAVPSEYADQRIDWQPCFDEPPPQLPPGGERLECGTLTAPMDWHNPDNGKEIRIAVSRLRRSLGVPDLITTVVKRGYRLNARPVRG